MKLVDISETTNDGVEGEFAITVEIHARLHTLVGYYWLANPAMADIEALPLPYALPEHLVAEIDAFMREAVMAERDAREEAATKAARQKPGHATAAPKIFVDAAFAPTVKYLN
jgi:hypothetical protein